MTSQTFTGNILNVVQKPQRLPNPNRCLDKSPLYRPSDSVTLFDSKLKQLIADMTVTMHAASGIGIAAPQVGVNQAIFIIDFPKPEENQRYRRLTNHSEFLAPVPSQLFINPIITKASDETVSFWHACLSCNGHPRGKIASYKWLEFKAQKPNGKIFEGRVEKMAAIIFQHEFRHLLGLTYLERATEVLDSETLFRAYDNGTMPFFSTEQGVDPHMIGDYQIGESMEEYQKRLFG